MLYDVALQQIYQTFFFDLQQILFMSNRSNVEVTITHTPQKRPIPDQKNKSHIQSTIPSIYQRSLQKQHDYFIQDRNIRRQLNDPNQFGYSYYINSEKKVSKNQWELKQKIDEYQTQIRLLRQYLRQSNSTCNCVEKSSIYRIFGFDDQKKSMYNEEQKIIKELGFKVKSLIKENSELKNSQATYSKLNINQIIRQNEHIKRLLEQYRASQAVTSQKLIHENRLLRADMKRIGFEYDQKLKLIQVEYARKLAQKQITQSHLKSRINSTQIKITNDLLKQNEQTQKEHFTKIHLIQENYRHTLQQNDRKWHLKIKQLEENQSKIKNIQDQRLKEFYQLKKKQEISQLRSTYEQLIINIQNQQDKKISILNNQIQQIAKRLLKTIESISHLKFERQNRLMSTIKKSKNIAEFSRISKGDDEQPVISNQQKIISTSNIRSSFQVKQHRSSFSSHNLILQQKIEYLNKELEQSRQREKVCQKIISEKTQKILLMQNQLRTAFNMSQSVSSNISQPAQIVVIQKPSNNSNSYIQQIKNIKQTIMSCNLNNFDIFENEFKEIITQRDQMNEKLQKIKQGAKQSSKSAILQKHLKVQRQKNKQLEENIQKYERQIQNLKIQVVELQSQMERIQAEQIQHDVNSVHIQNSNLFSNGKSALEWQKVVKHCLMTSINRLQNIQNCMKEDLKKN